MLYKKTQETNLLTVEDDNVNLIPGNSTTSLRLESYLNYVESILLNFLLGIERNNLYVKNVLTFTVKMYPRLFQQWVPHGAHKFHYWK